MTISHVTEWEVSGTAKTGALFLGKTIIGGREAWATVQIKPELVRDIGEGIPDFVARDLHRVLKKLADGDMKTAVSG